MLILIRVTYYFKHLALTKEERFADSPLGGSRMLRRLKYSRHARIRNTSSAKGKPLHIGFDGFSRLTSYF